MLEAIAPVLYFAPSIINQIQISNDDGLMVSKSNLKKFNLTTSLKILIDKLFVPIGSEVSVEGKTSKESKIRKQYDDLSRAVKTVKEAQKEFFDSELDMEIDTLGVWAYVEGTFKLSTLKAMIDNTLLVSVICTFGEYTICGVTSIDNWASKSLINQLLMHGEVTGAAIVVPLSVKDKKIQAKIACIFAIKEALYG